jgi:hypothetical protein
MSNDNLDLEELYLTYGPQSFERIYGKHVRGNDYIISSVPFLASTYAFCDIVRVRLMRDQLVVQNVVQPSSFQTIRLEGAYPDNRLYRALLADLDANKCVIGWQLARNITSIAAPFDNLSKVVATLQHAERVGVIRVIDRSTPVLHASA